MEATQGSASRGARVFAGLVSAFAVAAGFALLERWIAPGTTPFARGWLDVLPLALYAGLALIGGAAAARRADIRAWALGALAWSFGVLALTELPSAPSTYHVGDGPWLYPVYLLAAVGAGLYAVAGPRTHAIEVRIAALLAFFASANARLFARDEDTVFALLLATALLGFVCAERRFTWADLARGPARALAWIAAAFLAWTFAASLLGASPTRSLAIWTNLLLGALIAWTLAGAPAPRDVGRVFAALIAGLGVSLCVLVVGVLETSRVLSFSWLRETRLRLFDLHPGLIAPFLAAGVCLALARAVAFRARPRTAATSGALLLALGVALALNQARASLLGAGVGALAFVVIYLRRIPRRPLPVGIAALGAVVLGVGVLVSPLGAGVRAKLEARTHTASALGQRYHYWQMAGGAVKRDPVFGQGLRSEFARTDLAAPSYLDGGDQGLHAHNLLFSIAEAAGVPAAFLFLLLVLGVLELGRRTVLSAESPSQRALAAGLVAALIAHLTANMLSMGQARLTIVPLYLWVALGLLAALHGAPERTPGRTPLRAPLAALALLLLCVSPLTGAMLVSQGRARLARGDAEQAARLFHLALVVNPLDRTVHVDVSRAEFARNRPELAVEALEAACASAPKQATLQFTRGAALLAIGRAAEAALAFERAATLNPLGRTAGDAQAAWGWALLRVGDVDAARERLAEALRQGSSYWKQIPKVRLPSKPGDPPEAARLGFLVGDPNTSDAVLPLDDLLAELGDEMRAALATDPPDLVRARRLFGRVVETYRDERVLREPFELVDAFAAAVPDRFSNSDSVYSRLLCDAGRFDEADAIASRTLGIRGHIPKLEILRYLWTRTRTSPDPALFARAQEIAASIDLLDQDDVWFLRGERTEIYGFLAELALRRGNPDAAARYHACQLFDLPDAAARARACHALLALEVRLGADDAVLAREAAQLVFQMSCASGNAVDDDALRGVALLLAERWSGRADAPALVANEVGCAGPLGARFVELLRVELAGH